MSSGLNGAKCMDIESSNLICEIQENSRRVISSNRLAVETCRARSSGRKLKFAGTQKSFYPEAGQCLTTVQPVIPE